MAIDGERKRFVFADGKERVEVVAAEGLGVIVRREAKNHKGRFVIEEECLIPKEVLEKVATAVFTLDGYTNISWER